MRTVLTMLALTGLLLAWAPAPASAQGEDVLSLAFEFSVDRFVFKTQILHDEEAAKDLRRTIDRQFGNRDGFVNQSEVANFHKASTLATDIDTPQCFTDFKLATLDGSVPRRLSALRTTIFGGLGPTNTTSAIIQTMHFEFAYPNTSKTDVAVRFDVQQLPFAMLALLCPLMAGNIWDWNAYAEMFSMWSGGQGSYNPYGSCCDSTEPLDLLPALAPAQPSGSAAASSDGTSLRIRPMPGHRIDPDTIRPAAMSALWDGSGLSADQEHQLEAMAAQPITFTIIGAPPPTKANSPDLGAVAAGALATGALTLAALALFEPTRYLLLKRIVAVPGFTRFAKDEVLEHDRRGELYQYIKNNPGSSFSDLRRVTEMANGTLVHHLRILEHQEYVKPVRDGFRTRFYVRGPKITPQPYLTRTQQDLLDFISSNPGITQKELAALVGLPRESVSYHAKRLASQGQLEVRTQGKWRRYFVPEPESQRLQVLDPKTG
jgi:predicted transcriptional regulator